MSETDSVKMRIAVVWCIAVGFIAVYIMIDTVTCDSIFCHPTLKIILIRS